MTNKIKQERLYNELLELEKESSNLFSDWYKMLISVEKNIIFESDNESELHQYFVHFKSNSNCIGKLGSVILIKNKNTYIKDEKHIMELTYYTYELSSKFNINDYYQKVEIYNRLQENILQFRKRNNFY